MQLDSKKIVFILLFSALALISSQINFSKLVGTENQFFTVFQFFGPIAGAFLGPVLGAVSVLVSETINFFVVGKELNLLNLARLFPMVLAAYYFGSTKKKDWSLVVPLAAIGAFVLHPIGQQVWFFALFWTIPILAKLLFAQNLLSKSIGATFTAHAVGGALWVYVFQTTPEYWIALIPIVITERLLFAGGIAASYIAMNTVLARVQQFLPLGIAVEPKYDLLKVFASKN
jgi:hypothetical protein